MKIVFLGTASGGTPTKDRNQTSVLLNHDSENILFDCGEGTQRQMIKAGISLMNITRICITHFHGDHVLGIPGLLQTLAINSYNKTLKIYGPRKTKQLIDNLLRAFQFVFKINIEVHEVGEGKFLETEKFEIHAARLKHPNCIGYRFQEKDKRKINLAYIKKSGIPRGPLLGMLQQGKSIRWKGKLFKATDATFLKKGKSIAFIFDTAYTENAVKLAKSCDLVVCESTFLHESKDKAEERLHLTAKQAAELAKKARAKKLILTHFSQRHHDKSEFLKEAKKVFPNTQLAEDFMKVEL